MIIDLYELLELGGSSAGIDVKIPKCDSLKEYMDYLKETKREITKLLKEDYWHQNEFEGNIRQETREKIRSRLLKIK